MKTLLFDIETAPNLAYVWGKWEQDVIAFSEHWYIITFSWKWLGEKHVHSLSLPQCKNYRKDKHDDKELCSQLWSLFNEADVVVGHNSDQFDIKKARARFLQHGFLPHAPFQSVDTRKVARKNFKFDSNKLDDLGEYLGVGRKIKHEGFEALWLGCIVEDDPVAWQKMRKYNEQDVTLVEKVYLRMRPWQMDHPNANLFKDTLLACPNCGSENVIKSGWRMTRTGKYQRWSCNNCGAWSKSPRAEKLPELVGADEEAITSVLR